MTIIGNHLICDCTKAIKSATCPRQMLSPKVQKSSFYYHCPKCNYDYICTQALKVENGKDAFGFNEVKKTVCRKCDTELVKRRWPEE